VKDAAASLTDFAERGQIVPEWDETSVRELLIKSYRLIYRIFDERIVILALIHGARPQDANVRRLTASVVERFELAQVPMMLNRQASDPDFEVSFSQVVLSSF
jgi:hypothetical protein